jgi:hypothetical protein
MVPARLVQLPRARELYGDRIDRLIPFLLKTDPLADAVVEEMATLPPGRGWAMLQQALAEGIGSVERAPPALAAFFAHVDHVPVWVSWETIDRGGQVLLRAGALGGAVLGTMSLVLGYADPGGNKPLVFSGRLQEQAMRRLNETSRFVQATCQPGGLHRFGDAFSITVRVRLMHAQVRRMIRASGRWRTDLWGEPINQHDMAGTSLLFSAVVLQGLRKLGFRITREEADQYMQLWRYSSYLIGLDPELLCGSEEDAMRIGELIRAMQGCPDDDSRALVAALLNAGVRAAKTEKQKKRALMRRQFGAGCIRVLLGNELAGQLDVPHSPYRHFIPAMRAVISRMEQARERVDLLQQVALSQGSRYWDDVLRVGLAGAPAEFGLPNHLSPAGSSPSPSH